MNWFKKDNVVVCKQENFSYPIVWIPFNSHSCLSQDKKGKNHEKKVIILSILQLFLACQINLCTS